LAHLDLTFHCDGEEDEEVDDEDGPEDGDVEALKECTHRRYENSLRCTIPVDQNQHNYDTCDTAGQQLHLSLSHCMIYCVCITYLTR